MTRLQKGKHSTTVIVADDGTSPVGTDEWNAAPLDTGMEGNTETTKTLATGKITPTDTVTIVAAETGTTDDFDLVTYSETNANDRIWFYADTGDTITLRHNQTPGAGEAALITASAGNITLSETVGVLFIRRGTTFYQVTEVTVGAGDALVANPLSQFAATTSLQLKNTISDETGSGALVFGTSPTLVTPILGVAAATTVNKVALTTPATNATLTIVEGATLTASATATVSGTNTGDEVAASATVSGVAELATITEVNTGTDAIRTITPAGLAGSALQTKVDGIEALADVTDETNVAATASVIANTAKVTNATHTGDVTGATALTIGANKVLLSMVAPAAKTEVISIALGDETTVLAAASTTVPVVTFHMPYAFTLTNIKAGCTTAPTGAAQLTVDVHEAGTTVMTTTKVLFTAASKTSNAPTITDTALAADSLIEIFVDQRDTNNVAAGLKVYLIGYQT